MSDSHREQQIMLKVWHGSIFRILAHCQGNPPVTLTKSQWYGALIFHLKTAQHKLLNKQLSFQWPEMPWHSCNVNVMYITSGMQCGTFMTQSIFSKFLIARLCFLVNSKFCLLYVHHCICVFSISILYCIWPFSNGPRQSFFEVPVHHNCWCSDAERYG